MAAEIKARVLGAELVERELRRIRVVLLVGVQRGLRFVAADLLERSANLAPILTGELIRSGRVSGRGFRRSVSYGTDHAIFAHEQITPAGPRGLGPISSQKTGTDDGPVGGHFLSRPFRKHADRYVKLIASEAGQDGRFTGRGRRGSGE